MKTCFADTARADQDELKQQTALVVNNPLIDTLLTTVTGLLAVLNEYRQIIALNTNFLKQLGVGDAEQVVGLRPGEAIGCLHAFKEPGGCGTSGFCSSCGAAIAIVVCLCNKVSVERKCAVRIRRNGKEDDLYLNVRAHPVCFDNRKLVLLFLQDITTEQRRANLERIFFHDMINIITGIAGYSELFLLNKQEAIRDNARNLNLACRRLINEIDLQKYLVDGDFSTLRPLFEELTPNDVLAELRNLFSCHPLVLHKSLVFSRQLPECRFKSDLSLLIRILSNMVSNALEASGEGEEVRVSAVEEQSRAVFSVWNRAAVPGEVAGRIFQRNFSTKQGEGRGLGTYSMKILGEQFLGGEVSFSSSESAGTEFRFIIETCGTGQDV